MRRFSLDELEVLEQDYRAAFQVRVLKDGKWVYHDPKPGGMAHLEGTRAERVQVRTVKTFTEYLREKYAGITA